MGSDSGYLLKRVDIAEIISLFILGVCYIFFLLLVHLSVCYWLTRRLNWEFLYFCSSLLCFCVRLLLLVSFFPSCPLMIFVYSMCTLCAFSRYFNMPAFYLSKKKKFQNLSKKTLILGLVLIIKKSGCLVKIFEVEKKI